MNNKIDHSVNKHNTLILLNNLKIALICYAQVCTYLAILFLFTSCRFFSEPWIPFFLDAFAFGA